MQRNRSFDGIFGVEISEWETVKDASCRDYESVPDNPADALPSISFGIMTTRCSPPYEPEYLEKGLSIQRTTPPSMQETSTAG